MSLYTIVDESFYVSVVRSIRQVANYATGMFIDEDHSVAATARSIKKALNEDGVVRIYSRESHDWVYKIQSH